MARRASLAASNYFNPDIAKNSGYNADSDGPATPEQKTKIDTAIRKSNPDKTLPARDYSKDSKPATAPSGQYGPQQDSPTAPAPKTDTNATPTASPASKPAPAAPTKPSATPAAKSPAAKSGYFSGSPNVSKGDYTIKKGDTLSAIAKAKGTSVGAIQSMNKGLTDVNKIAAGGQLNLPTAMKSPSTSSSPASDVKPTSTGPEFPKAKASPSTVTPPRRPSMGPEAPAPKADPVTPSTPATPTGGSPSMKPDYHRTTLPGNKTGDVTPTAKPTAMAPDVGRSTSQDTNAPSISVAPEKSSVPSSSPPEEKKKAPTPPPATTAVEHRLSESVVTIGSNKYRIV